jgi:PelA/Pel-15E family pectate lyase
MKNEQTARKVKMRKIIQGITAVLPCFLMAEATSFAQDTIRSSIRISWSWCLNRPDEFYSTEEAIRIADNVLLYQRDNGGWPKGVIMTRVLSNEDKNELLKTKNRKDATLDNGSTHTQIRYLAKVYHATKLERFRETLLKGIDYLLEAQYDNGGWPQFYPWEGHPGYSKYITFNDGAMIGAMSVLRDIAEKKPVYTFVDEERLVKAEKAVQKGIECILKCQIIDGDKRTGWCQQYDEKTFEPRDARIYEKVSNCSRVSVGIVKFLMEIDNPDSEITEAVQSAIAWFDRSRLNGIRMVIKRDESLERGFDRVIIEDDSAPPIWARFYQLGTNRPIFCGRDGVIKYSMSEIEHERRTNYAWYTHEPAGLLNKDYPAWQQKWAPGNNVLNK